MTLYIVRVRRQKVYTFRAHGGRSRGSVDHRCLVVVVHHRVYFASPLGEGYFLKWLVKLIGNAPDMQLLSLHNEAVETKIDPAFRGSSDLVSCAGRRLEFCEGGCKRQVARQNRIYQTLLYALDALLAQ